MREGLSVSVCRHWHQTLCKPLQSEKRVRGQVPESAAVLVLQRAALHDKPVGLSLDKVLHVQRGHFTFLIAYLHGLICNTTYFSEKIYFIGKVSTTSRAK